MGLSAALTWWDHWQLRILVLGSLSVQGFLFFSAWVRKLHALRRLRPVVWIAYIAGDALAIYALATLFNRRRYPTSDVQVGAPAPAPSSPFSLGSSSLEIIWAPILLIHLGGQQAISAYGLEDNELWKRHAITLLSQVTVAVYVFSKWWSGEEKLLAAAVVLFIAGIVKYVRKPLVLWSASFNFMLDNAANFGLRSRIPTTKWWSKAWTMCTENLFLVVAQDLATSRIEEEINHSLEEYVREARRVMAEGVKVQNSQEEDNIVTRLRGLHHSYAMFVDVPAPYWSRLRDLRQFLQYNDNEAHHFFRRLLDHVFDMLYTGMRSSVNVLNSCINLFFLPGLMVASFVLFAKSHKDGYNRADVRVTYILLGSHLALELAAWLFDVPFYRLSNMLKGSSATSCHDMVFQHNLLSWCIRKNTPTGLMNLAACICLSEYTNKHWYIEQEAAASRITGLVTRHVRDGWSGIHDAAGYKRFNNLRGQQTLGPYNQLQWMLKVPFDQSVLLWHIATDLCFYYDTAGQGRATGSRLISNYMAYLLFHRPEMLMPGTKSGLFDIACYQFESQMGFIDLLFPENPNQMEFIDEPLNIESYVVQKIMYRVMSVGNLATLIPRLPIGLDEEMQEAKEKIYYSQLIVGPCDLAKSLMGLQEEERWQVIQGVWLEMLCYSASRCRGYLHAKSLGEGGEFLTNVWLLLSYMGMETLTYTIQSPELPQVEDPGTSACTGARGSPDESMGIEDTFTFKGDVHFAEGSGNLEHSDPRSAAKARKRRQIKGNDKMADGAGGMTIHHQTYKRGGKLILNGHTSLTSELRLACEACEVLEKHNMDNFKKPESEQVPGIMVKFKPENFLQKSHTNLCEFPVTWDDLSLMLNFKAFDASIMRCCILHNFIKAREHGWEIAFVDPHLASQQTIDDESKKDESEKVVADYLINVMEKSKDKELILWPFNKSYHWILICISLVDGIVYYLDSYRNKGTNFEGVTNLIDRSFEVFRLQGGKTEGYTKLTHDLNYPCHQQPNNADLCGFYVVNHMNIMMDRIGSPATASEDPPIDVKELSNTTLAKIRTELAEFLVTHVLKDDGQFHHNADVEVPGLQTSSTHVLRGDGQSTTTPM